MTQLASTMSRKKMEQQSRRDFIADAARRLFATRGVGNTGMEEIAEAVGYTRRTLYFYFKSYDEIALTVLTGDLTRRWAIQQEALKSAVAGLDKIRIWGESLYQYSKQNPESIRIQMFWDFRGIDRNRLSRSLFAEFRSINDALAEGLRGIFRLGVGDRTVRSDIDTDMCISQYLYSLRNVINRALSPGYSFAAVDPDKYVQTYIDLFCRGISNLGGDRHE